MDSDNALTTIHGNAMVMFGYGILVTGDSGTGKTWLCQQLLERGHQIIADDAVTLSYNNKNLYASSPPLTRGKIALNPNTILSVHDLYGQDAWVEKHELNLHVELDQTHKTHSQQNHTQALLTIQATKTARLDAKAFELLVQNTIDCGLRLNPPGKPCYKQK